jgi:hypothetical protein
MDWQHVGSILRSVDPGNQVLWFVSQQHVDVLQLPSNFVVRSDDRDYGEYIYDCFDQAACAGGRFEGMRRQVRSFFKQYGGALTVKVDSSPTADTLTHQSVMHLFDDWLHFGTDGSLDAHDEAEALKAFFDPRNHMFFNEMVIIRLLYNDRLVGFSVSEILNDNYATNIFHKTNLNMSGISYYMFYTMMEILQQKDIQYLNFQEDVGIPGLRAFKEKMKPDFIDTRCRIEFLG